MFYDKEFNFLKNLLTKYHLQHLIIDPYNSLDKLIDMGAKILIGSDSNNKTFIDFFPYIKPNTIYRITDVFLCKYIFFELPYHKSKTIFFVGPYLSEDISQQKIMEQAENFKISPKFSKELEYFYSSLPLVADETTISVAIDTFAEYIWHGPDNFDVVQLYREDNDAFVPNILKEATFYDNSSINIQMMESRYNFENELINAVTQGNIHKAEHMMTNISSLAFENRTPDRLRNIKNYCIIMNTLFRKAAENGGVHPVYIDSVSSDIAKRIEALHTTSLARDFMIEILRFYCRLVKQYSSKKLSALIQGVIVKIENDLTEDLSLRTIAELCSVSPAYLSARFKKETGKTLTEYVNGKRVSAAKHLLRNTNLQIQTIAQHCGILDLHYFCRTFKSTVGKTPSEYRNMRSFN